MICSLNRAEYTLIDCLILEADSDIVRPATLRLIQLNSHKEHSPSFLTKPECAHLVFIWHRQCYEILFSAVSAEIYWDFLNITEPSIC